ncbi:MAG: hypothetical protein HYS32_00300 [Candidatus Woesearchaeota archaeon]|nr:MAG: hypothetical protein HYS32_00300 [Candidatus Woesearchaeota archaeon]
MNVGLQPRDKKGWFIDTKPSILVNKPSVELAEFIGIMLGDGNLTKAKAGNYQIRIVGHIENGKEHLSYHVAPLAKRLFGITFGIYEKREENKLYLSKGSKHLFYTLIKFGLMYGNKKSNNVKIPKWIFKDKNYLKACVRGLVDTDGCVCPITGRDYTYVWFKSSIPNLRKSFSKAMDVLGYKIAKWSGPENTQTFIGSKEIIKKYYKEIGFNNPYHERRFMIPE